MKITLNVSSYPASRQTERQTPGQNITPTKLVEVKIILLVFIKMIDQQLSYVIRLANL